MQDVNIVLSFLYLTNDVGLFKKLGFSGSVVVMGTTGVGKTSCAINGLGAASNINNVITGKSKNNPMLLNYC